MSTATTTEFAALTGTYVIDGAHSRVGFVARHAMVAKVRGSFTDFEGTLAIDGEHPEASSAKVTIQVASVDTRNAQRNAHLRTNEILDAEAFPTITFTSTGITHVGGTDFEVTGDLTIKDVTKRIVVPVEYLGSATDPMGNQRIGFEGSTTIQRGDFGVTYNAVLEAGGVMISDAIVLEVEVSAIKQ